GGSGAVEDDFYVADTFANDFQSIEQSGSRNNGGAVLVVMEDGNLHRFLQRLFDVKAIGSLDVFEVDSAERGFEQLAELDDLVGIVAVDFDIEDVDIGEAFEEDGLTFHDGFAREGSDVAEAEDGGAVAEDGDEIAASGVFEGIVGIISDREARLGDAGRVGQA